MDGPLAEGGMGAVYRVRSPLTKRLVAALKIMKATSEPDARARFVREAEALAALHHPAVVRVMEFAEDASRGLLYLVMELAEGETLRERLEHGPVELEEALRIFLPLAQGLEHAHNFGVFHRDLKPSNIILCSDRSVRLVDFGISAAQHAEPLTNSGRLGTLAYLPPEAFKGEKIKPARADVYGFGLVAYEALTGQRSFPIDPNLTPAAAAAAVGVRKLQQAGAMELPERFPLLLRELVRAATSADPADRPRMSDIRAGLEELAGRPVSKASHGPVERVASPIVQVSDEATMRVPDPMEEAGPSTSPPSRPPRPYVLAVGLAALVALGATVLMGRSAQRASSADGVAPGALASPAPAPTPSRSAPAIAPSAVPPASAPEPEKTATPLPQSTPPVPENREASPPAPTPEPVEEEAAADEAPAPTELGGRWELTLEEARAHDSSPSRRGGYRLTLQQEGDRVFGRGYKLTENGAPLPEEQRTALEVEGRVEGRQLVLTFVERGGGSYNSGWMRWAIAPGGRALSGRFASDAGQSGGSSVARRVR